MVAACFSEKSVYFNRTTRRHVPEDSILFTFPIVHLQYFIKNVYVWDSPYNDGLYDPGSIPGRPKISLLHSVQAGFGAHPASYSMDNDREFPGG
jgi:hypothetical protein